MKLYINLPFPVKNRHGQIIYRILLEIHGNNLTISVNTDFSIPGWFPTTRLFKRDVDILDRSNTQVPLAVVAVLHKNMYIKLVMDRTNHVGVLPVVCKPWDVKKDIDIIKNDLELGYNVLLVEKGKKHNLLRSNMESVIEEKNTNYKQETSNKEINMDNNIQWIKINRK